MHCSVATLIQKAFSSDDIGNQIPIETETLIYTTEKSMNRYDWAEAGRIGLNPSHLLVTAAVNYSGETEIDYEGERYSIYRTYQRGDEIELYLEKKGGVQDDNSGTAS